MNWVTTKRKKLIVVATTQSRGAGAHRLVDQISAAFDDAIVVNWESLEGTFGLPDVDDEHVVAAALVGGADVIVTSNRKTFLRNRSPSRSRDIARQFAADTVAVSPDTAHQAVIAMSSRFVRPPPRWTRSRPPRCTLRHGEAVELIRSAR